MSARPIQFEATLASVGDPFELLEHVPSPAYVFEVVDDDYVLVTVNAAARAANPALTSLYGKPMGALYQDQPQVLEDARRAVRDGVPVRGEYPLRRYDRTEATLYLRLTFVPAPPGHLVIHVEPLPSDAMTQAALRESESRYESLVASLPDGLLVRGPDGRVIACNDVLVHLVGAKAQAELLGKHDVLSPGYKVVDESGAERLEREGPSRQVLSTGKAAAGRVYALVHGPETRWLRIAAQPIRTAGGAIGGSVTTFTDITERVLAQRAIRESADRLALALDAARMGVWEYDAKADVGWWSEKLDEIFRFSPRELSLAGFVTVVHPDDIPAFQALAMRVLAEEVRTFEHEFRILGGDGVTRWARVQGRIAREGERLGAVGTVMDVTDRHRLEEELQRAHRLESIGRLAGGIAHDFNNLLAAIMGSTELIEPVIPAEAREDFVTIQHAASRARDLTKQLLAFARKQPVELGVVDLASLVDKVELMLRRLVGPSIELVIVSEGPVLVLGDASSLEQVLVNLVVNARDAMPSGGRLEVRVHTVAETSGEESSSRLAAVEVADSGVGMDAATRVHVFDPFFTTKSHGTGLGLASSYGTVKQHGGDIVVESAPERGTLFRVLLPLAAGATPVDEARDPTVGLGARRGRVLVVDDEEMVRTTTARLVESLGYDVVSTADAEGARRAALDEEQPIDVLLCDVAMPGRDGPSIAKELWALAPRLEVIFVSGYAEMAERMDLTRAGFLQKPFGRSELAAKLLDAFDKARSSGGALERRGRTSTPAPSR